MEINLPLIKRILFENVKDHIIKSYGIFEQPRDSDHFSKLLITSLNQKVKPIKRKISNEEVFEAAVKSIGSNSRPWSTFISKEPELKKLLSNYNPIKISIKEENEFLLSLRKYFIGTSCSTDCRSILAWIKQLNNIPDYYNNVILKIVEGFESLNGTGLRDDQLIICMSGFLSNPSVKWEGFNSLGDFQVARTRKNLKLNGMGFPLAAEFFRNLGWNGFKPDRHIKRLLRYWYDPENIVEDKEIFFYSNLIGSRNKELVDNIRFSLIGHKISPKDVQYSEVDNFIWALGSFVMKKGKEKKLVYVYE